MLKRITIIILVVIITISLLYSMIVSSYINNNFIGTYNVRIFKVNGQKTTTYEDQRIYLQFRDNNLYYRYYDENDDFVFQESEIINIGEWHGTINSLRMSDSNDTWNGKWNLENYSDYIKIKKMHTDGNTLEVSLSRI